MILLIDNYDSFVFNLARYFVRLGQQVEVVRNDRVDPSAVRARRPVALVLSPGPCDPRRAGRSLELVGALAGELPILGVCLGHQVIAESLGGRVVRAAEPVHGRASLIEHAGQSVFRGLPSPIRGGRYHSLVVDERSLPDCLEVTARTPEGTIMALAHRRLPLVGLQFHPESVLTDHGYAILRSFLEMTTARLPAAAYALSSELRPEEAAPFEPPAGPVTF